MVAKKKPTPQFKRFDNMMSSDVADLLSILAADGYEEWDIVPDIEETVYYKDIRDIDGKAREVDVEKVRTLSWSIMAWWEDDDEDEE